MDVKATVDVGTNLTSLIEQLAHQIGVASDKVFPWYVKQQVLEGYLFVGLTSFAWAVLIAVFLYGFKKADFDNGNRYAIMTIVASVGFLVCAIFTIAGGIGAVTQILNPEYAAIHQIAHDLQRLR